MLSIEIKTAVQNCNSVCFEGCLFCAENVLLICALNVSVTRQLLVVSSLMLLLMVLMKWMETLTASKGEGMILMCDTNLYYCSVSEGVKLKKKLFLPVQRRS